MDRTTARPCLECSKPLNRHGKGDFCTPACKAKFHNRRTREGALIRDVLLLHRKLPDQTKDFPARLELLLKRIEATDKAVNRRRSTRALMDVQYDSDFPRTYELPADDLDTDAEVRADSEA